MGVYGTVGKLRDGRFTAINNHRHVSFPTYGFHLLGERFRCDEYEIRPFCVLASSFLHPTETCVGQSGTRPLGDRQLGRGQGTLVSEARRHARNQRMCEGSATRHRPQGSLVVTFSVKRCRNQLS